MRSTCLGLRQGMPIGPGNPAWQPKPATPFLMSAVFQRMASEGKSVAALLFNVKGPDLICWTNLPSPTTNWRRLPERDRLTDIDRMAYRSIGLEPRPFENLRIFAPFKPGQQPGEAGRQPRQRQIPRHPEHPARQRWGA